MNTEPTLQDLEKHIRDGNLTVSMWMRNGVFHLEAYTKGKVIIWSGESLLEVVNALLFTGLIESARDIEGNNAN
jgi:hypothetical protein